MAVGGFLTNVGASDLINGLVVDGIIGGSWCCTWIRSTDGNLILIPFYP